MRLKVAPQIFKDYSGLRVGVIVAHNINNTQHREKVHGALEHEQKQIKDLLTLETLDKHPHITAWREAYKKFGAKPKKYLSSVENIATRVLKGSELQFINPLIDVYRMTLLKYLLPISGEDLDAIKGDVELVIAEKDEKPVVLLGEQEARAPEPGEIIYKDENGAKSRRWNWKEADRTKLTEKTRNALLIIEALPEVDGIVFKDAVHELGYLIESYCGGTTSVAFLDESHPEVVLKRDGQYVPLNEKQPLSGAEYTIYGLVQLAAEEEEKKKIVREHEVRVHKVEELRAQGINPWPSLKAHETIKNTCKQVVDEYKDDDIERQYEVGGRIMSKREHGRALFADIQDRTGSVQIYLKVDDIGQECFDTFARLFDIGDYIYCQGSSFKTKAGEVTLLVKDFRLVSKCLYPLPEKFHGIADVEMKYRQRYLDLMTSEESREKFKNRAKVITQIRKFLDDRHFIEVETPVFHPIPGGAAARPFVTYHNALDSEFYLRIAPELYLKRLVIGGFERVYEISRNFRNEGISTRHNPEFTMVEFYVAHHDYHYAMDLVEQLFKSIAEKIYASLHIPFGQQVIDFSQSFARFSVKDVILHYTHLKAEDLSPEKIDETMASCHIKLDNKEALIGQKLFAIFEELVESQLIQPTFIIDYPIETSPLSKRDPANPELAARFELFMAGMELANGFNELNDPFDQAERFKEQAKALAAGDQEAMYYDADFIHALEYGLPPTVGVGVGIDRLVMLMTNTTSIKDVILFPTLKKKKS